jgi:hypothetical protein
MLNLNKEYPKNLLAYLLPKYLESSSPSQISSTIQISGNVVANILARWKVSSASNADTICHLIRRGRSYSFLGILANSADNKLVGDIVRRAIRDKELELAKGDNVLNLFAALLKFISEGEQKQLASLFIEADDIVLELENIREGALSSLLPAFLLLIDHMNEQQIVRALVGIERVLSSTIQEEWGKAFASLTKLVYLLSDLKDYESKLSLTTAFCEAFKQWLTALFEGKEQKSELKKEDVAILFHFLDAAFKEDVAVWINQLARHKAFALRPFEAELVNRFSAHDKWTEADGETLCSSIQKAVSNKDKATLPLLIPILNAGLNKFKPSNRFSSTLKEPVESWLKDASDDVAKLLHELCEALNIQLDPTTLIHDNRKP